MNEQIQFYGLFLLNHAGYGGSPYGSASNGKSSGKYGKLIGHFYLQTNKTEEMTKIC